MIRVLFVCLGNICRSPMAEAVFRHKVDEAGLSGEISADSAGTGDWHLGKPPHEGTCRILERSGISYEGMAARQVQPGDLSAFDYVVAMDSQNLKDLGAMGGATIGHKLYKMMDFVPEAERLDVPDPYYTGNFDEVYALLDTGCTRLLAHIRKKDLQIM